MADREETQKFLFSSPAWFVGETSNGEFFKLIVAFHDFGRLASESIQAGPRRRSFQSLSLQVELPEAKRIVHPDARGFAAEVVHAITAYYGKLFVMHGCVQRGNLNFVPDLSIDAISGYHLYPFNDLPRKATDVPLNLSRAGPLIASLNAQECAGQWSRLSPACTFYHAALTHFSQDASLSYVLLLSALECLAANFDVDQERLFGEEFWSKLQRIVKEVDGGDKIVRDLCGRLTQIGQRCAFYVQSMLDAAYFSNIEAELGPTVCMKSDEVSKRVKASYGLRSKFLHEGRAFGTWVESPGAYHAEVMLGEPVMDDKKFAAELKKSLSLTGLERVVQYCLFREISLVSVPLPPEELQLHRA